MRLFLSTFGLIFLAELPDKTAFATLVLATKKHPLAVFLGVAGAFTVQSGVAVLFGSVLGLLPESVVKIGAALLFLAFAVSMWLRDDSEGEKLKTSAQTRAGFWKAVGSSFLVIFIAEWGDITQLATAALTAKSHAPWTIFFAATLALWCVTALAIAVGRRLKRHIRPERLQKVAAVVFALAGVGMLITGFAGARL